MSLSFKNHIIRLSYSFIRIHTLFCLVAHEKQVTTVLRIKTYEVQYQIHKPLDPVRPHIFSLDFPVIHTTNIDSFNLVFVQWGRTAFLVEQEMDLT